MTDNLIITDLFCCPICKGDLLQEKSSFKCGLCEQRFFKRGDVYDFQIKISKNDRSYQKIVEEIFKKQTQWFKELFDYVNFSEYKKLLFDPELQEIQEHINQLKNNGEDIGARYEKGILSYHPKGDLNTKTALNYIKNKDIKDAVAIDLGCGTLRMSRELLRAGFQKIIAFDLLPETMLYTYQKLSEKDKQKITLIKGDARLLPFKEKSIDYIFALELFEHINTPLILLLELKRTLKSKGMAIINTWNAAEIRNRRVIRQKGKAYYENGFFYHLQTYQELKAILKKIKEIDFGLRAHSCYYARSILNALEGKSTKPIVFMDRILGYLLPRFLFHHLIFFIQKK